MPGDGCTARPVAGDANRQDESRADFGGDAGKVPRDQTFFTSAMSQFRTLRRLASPSSSSHQTPQGFIQRAEGAFSKSRKDSKVCAELHFIERHAHVAIVGAARCLLREDEGGHSAILSRDDLPIARRHPVSLGPSRHRKGLEHALIERAGQDVEDLRIGRSGSETSLLCLEVLPGGLVQRGTLGGDV